MSPNNQFLARSAIVGVLGFAHLVSYVKCLGIVQDAARTRGEHIPRSNIGVVVQAFREPHGFAPAVLCVIAGSSLAILVYQWMVG
jgi:hypothetical protein